MKIKFKIEYNGVRDSYECDDSETGAFVHGMVSGNLAGKTKLYGHPELFDRNGRQIEITDTLAKVGVKDGDVLLFRPTVIR